MLAGRDPLKIGERDAYATLDFVKQNQLSIAHSDTIGTISRTVHLELSTGTVNLHTAGAKSRIALN